jgi:rod shape determining protein RodA
MITVEKKRKIDMVLLIALSLLIAIGTLSIFSSTIMLDFKERIIRTHIIAILAGVISMIFMWILDYQLIDEYSDKFYLFSLFLLFLVLIIGVVDKGSRSWFRLPFFSVQPSEIARISLIAFISSYLSKNKDVLRDFYGMIKVSLLILPFFVLMMKQPDFSGILITFFPLLVMFVAAGINMVFIYIFIFYLAIVMISPIISVMIRINPQYLNNPVIEALYSISFFNLNLIYFMGLFSIFLFALYKIVHKLNPTIESSYFILFFSIVFVGHISGIFVKNQIKDYQYKRIESFFNPSADPRGAGYNIIQARVALGSGGIRGKGFFSGTQSRLGFIPERHTDFIFSVVGEEMGFIGVSLIIVAYLVIINRIKKIASMAKTSFAYYICCGFAGLFMGYFFVNIGMILGFFPVAGIGLAFVSYGGTNMVASFIIIGILQSIYTRRLTIA